MTAPDDFNSPKAPSKFASKKLRLIIIIIIVAVAVIIFAIWLFSISGAPNPYYDNVVLPPNCYSLNGKQICPNP